MSKNDYREIFKRNLNHYMTQHDIKQTDIVKALGVSKSIVSDWCKGEKIPRIDKIEKLAETLQTTPEYLLGWENRR